MVKRAALFLIVVCMAILYCLGCSQEKPQPTGIHALVPGPGDVSGWEPADTVQVFVGEDLYLLIDGGAEIFHEYGFDRVAACEFKGDSGKMVSLEIYDMTSPEAAYGMYSFKAGRNGKAVNVGTDGLKQGYYIIFWKDHYLVTVTGYDNDPITLKGIAAIAATVDKHISEEKPRPVLPSLLDLDGLSDGRTTYIKGELALNNIHVFGPPNLFAFESGTVADFGDLALFVFSYASPDSAENQFKRVAATLADDDEYHDLTANASSLSVYNDLEQILFCEHYKSYLLVYLGANNLEGEALLEKVKARIDRYSGSPTADN